MTQREVGLSAEINFEINAAVCKVGAKFGFNVSLTDQWSKSQTETISFRIPAGERAFLYQVTILCARLRQALGISCFRLRQCVINESYFL